METYDCRSDVIEEDRPACWDSSSIPVCFCSFGRVDEDLATSFINRSGFTGTRLIGFGVVIEAWLHTFRRRRDSVRVNLCAESEM